MLNEHLRAKTDEKANPASVKIVGKLRISVLTPRLIRVEKGAYTDSATQAVWYRNFPPVPYNISEKNGQVIVSTDEGAFAVNRESGDLIYAVRDGVEIPYDPDDNRLGTARTLDKSNGSVKLEKGLISKSGVSEMRDDTLILGEDGMVHSREDCSDRYYFNSASERTVLRDYYAITGFPPLPPRYALGNWWSRYWKYSANEYLELLRRFKKENVPFWFTIVDMDWHWVNVLFKYGYWWWKDKPYQLDVVSLFMPGWTGFSWNTKLFPDPKAFLNEVHSMGYHISLNLHPADGVRYYEDRYRDVCEAVGQDPSEKRAVKFDITSEKFINAYFDRLLHPLEEEGVESWWIDWQQGKKSKLKGYDPLWACNHYHTLDSKKNGKRPLILSRYAGIGSHRYPIGFSGDTYVTWKALDYQPFFTANATNAGYPAWSHDLGGHMHGEQKDDELYLRWIQFGVMSPVFRLHSQCFAVSKEPWNHKSVEEIAKNWMRFRHRLVPYIYTAMAETTKNGIALIEPLYYRTDEPEGEKYPNEYYFGSELLVAPITSPSVNGVSKLNIWLPKGKWTDIFTGEVLNGGIHTVERGLKSIPVFLREGGILPLQDDVEDQSNPNSLTVWTAQGNGEYVLFEDDNETNSFLDGVEHFTRFTSHTENGEYSFVKHSGEGEASLVPESRRYTVRLPFDGEVSAYIGSKPVDFAKSDLTVTVENVRDEEELLITVKRL